MAQVITYGDTRGGTVNVCEKCEKQAEGNWPRNAQGEEYCQVQHGLHDGVCDICGAGRKEAE